MKWTTEVPKMASYYWAKPNNPDSWLDSTPEIVYLYFDGKWSVIRPGEEKNYPVSSIAEWSDEPIPRIDDPNDK